MCISPLYKKNPYYQANPLAHMTHDCEHAYITIPCGHCDECLAVRQSSYIQRIQSESEYNHLFFATLTYDNKHLPSIYIDVPQSSEATQVQDSQGDLFASLFNPDGSLCEDAVSALSSDSEAKLKAFDEDSYDEAELSELADQPSGEISVESTNLLKVDYADIHHLQLMFKRMRDNNRLGRNFRYVAVSERGSKRGRPHFHIIFFVPKLENDTLSTCETLNQILKDMLLQYWSTNVGTRKNPIYERNFTYKQRWIDRKLYRNFDCHYVNPVLTTGGVSNVAYYVTKYIFKDSEKENALKQLLFCNTDSIQDFYAVWDLVKSRCVCSKGLGLDAEFITVDKLVQERKPVYEIAEEMNAQVRVHEDLPEDDFELAPVSEFRNVWKKKRILIPNFELVQKLKDNALLEKEKGHAIYVKYNGEHVTLANYYRKRILSADQITDLYFSWDSNRFPDTYGRADNLTSAHIKRVECRRLKKIDMIDQHEVIDSLAHDIEKGQSIDPYDPYRGIAKYWNLDGKVRPKILLGK